LIEFPLAAAAAGVTFALGFLTAKVLEGRPKRNALNAGNTGGSPYAPDDPWSEVGVGLGVGLGVGAPDDPWFISPR